MAFTIREAALGAIIEGIFYGVYMVLFTLSLVLRRRNNRTVDGPLTLAQILLFGLCTLFFCLDISGDYFAVVAPNTVNRDVLEKLSVGTTSVFSIIDCLAQMILLYRCWIIWDKRWAVVTVPGFLALISLGIGLTVAGLFDIPNPEPTDKAFLIHLDRISGAAYFISLCASALTTVLIVTKILLISREIDPVLGSAGPHLSFRVVIAMLIESGLLMFVSQFVYALLYLFPVKLSACSFIMSPVTQLYGITPTLLNIRVIMGSSYDKTTRMVSSLKFQSQAINRNSIYTQDVDIRLDDVPDSRSGAGNTV